MSRMLANGLLLLAAALWGFGNVAQKTVLDHLDPISAVGCRCLIGGLLVLPLLAVERCPGRGRGYWTSLIRVGALFSISIILQQVAYLSTSVTHASFLVNTCTVMTPIAAWAIVGERPTIVIGLAASLTLAGILLLSGGMSGAIASGDIAALLSAVCYALWMVELGRHMHGHGGAVPTALAQFLGCAAIALPFGFGFGNLSMPGVQAAAPELAVLGVFSTAVAFGIQTIAQRFTPASHAAVMVSGESVFGATGAVLFLGETLSLIATLGGAMVLAAIIYLAIAGQARQAADPSPAG